MKQTYLALLILLSGSVAIARAVSASGSFAPSVPETSGSDSAFHFAGYADTAYFINDQGSNEFTAKLAPIAHYLYQDWFFIEAEGEFEFEQGDTTTTGAGLEYAMLNVIINDNLLVGVGRFLSPVGQFIQNLHPSWINKLPTMPIGFAGGHGGAGAAPNTDFGVQARGGFKTGPSSRMNYAVFIGNGPDLIVEETATGGLVIEGYELLAKIKDSNNNKSTGLRLGFLPVPYFEIGTSYNQADAAFARIKPYDGPSHDADADTHPTGSGIRTMRDRSYRVWSLDYHYAPPQMKNFAIRGEYVSTRLGAGQEDESDHGSKKWEAWYSQATYSLANNKVEAVVRYGQFTTPGGPTKNQLALGLNYLFKTTSLVKAAYVINSTDNQIIFQYAYGF